MKKILIIGAGPSGLYLSKRMLKQYPNKIFVDLVDKSYLAGGLLRTGVAPDHPEIKNALKNFDEIFSQNNFNFYGNLKLEAKILKDLIQDKYYDSIIFADGSGEPRDSYIQNEELLSDSIILANDVTNYYNENYMTNICQKKLNNLLKAEKILIIGNGNVSLDIARIFTKQKQKMQQYQIPNDLLNFCEKQKQIIVIARRGIIQSAFDLKEFRELNDESQNQIIFQKEDILQSLDYNSLKLLDIKHNIQNRKNKRKFQFIQYLSQQQQNSENKVEFKYFLNPHKIELKNNRKFLICKKTKLVYNGNASHSISTEQTEKIEFDVIIKSMGFTKNQFSKNFLFHQNLNRCGWSESGGVGKLNDSYFSCERLINDWFKIEFKNEYIQQNKSHPIKRDDTTDKDTYLKIREFEIKNNCEIKSLKDIKSFIK